MTRQQDSVGLTTFDTEIRLDMPARSSPRHFNEMMQRLEAVAPGQRNQHRPRRCTNWPIASNAAA